MSEQAISSSERLPLEHADRSRATPLIVVGVVLIAAVMVLRLMGRVWWCQHGDWAPVTLEAWGPHNSQHIADPYVFSHFLHGVVFFFLFNWSVMRRKPMWGLVCAMLLEVGWEIFENTPFTINRYRAETAAVGYTGDSVINSLGDMLACLGGWFVARRVGWMWSIVLYLVLEIGCAVWIKDNLTLNVIQFTYPIEAIKRWQSGG